jgi:hypothetical protein
MAYRLNRLIGCGESLHQLDSLWLHAMMIGVDYTAGREQRVKVLWAYFV